ncbi:MAG: hypothetical protein GPJ51_12115 [Candidatus Heimdallarchaeota archaeon]|nr:hypothetical protein [Candidatus Heimdallarchaeota archaeon]
MERNSDTTTFSQYIIKEEQYITKRQSGSMTLINEKVVMDFYLKLIDKDKIKFFVGKENKRDLKYYN